jgi:hypothetical protein
MRTISKKSPKNLTKKSTSKSSKPYIVAIPSYNRSEVLAKKTLHTLQQGSVPSSKIHIFVANKEEYDRYNAAIPKELYGKMIIGELGITNQRRFIVDYFNVGPRGGSLDVDVMHFLKMRFNGWKMRGFIFGAFIPSIIRFL